MPPYLYECPSILTSGAQKAGTIGTLEAPFDSPERWKDDGAIGAMWYVCTHHTPFVRCSAKTKIIPCTQSIFLFYIVLLGLFRLDFSEGIRQHVTRELRDLSIVE